MRCTYVLKVEVKYFHVPNVLLGLVEFPLKTCRRELVQATEGFCCKSVHDMFSFFLSLCFTLNLPLHLSISLSVCLYVTHVHLCLSSLPISISISFSATLSSRVIKHATAPLTSLFCGVFCSSTGG